MCAAHYVSYASALAGKDAKTRDGIKRKLQFKLQLFLRVVFSWVSDGSIYEIRLIPNNV